MQLAWNFKGGENMEREKRTERINMKVLPSIKKLAEKNAREEGRTLSNYIEKLIREAEETKAGK